MNEPITLSIFFPTYNEEENIRETIMRTIDVVERSPYVSQYEILVVNDGSKDRTAEIVEEISALHPAVRLINHPQNMGYGAALKTGISAAKMDYVFFTDADLQFDIMELQNLLIHLGSYPVVIGYRAPRQDPAMRILNARVWNFLNRVLFGLRIKDIDCAFKLFKRENIQSLPLRSKGAMMSAEILIRLTRTHVAVKEVPVSHLPRHAGSPTGAKPSVILRALREMVMLYRNELGLVTQKEAMKFMTVGVLNTALDAIAYIVLTRGTVIFADHLVAAKFFSFLLGTISSLAFNRSWTFGVRSRLTSAEVARFYSMTSVSIAVNVLAMNFLVGLGMYDLLALAITTVGTFAVNFTISKFWVFKKQNPVAIEQPSVSARVS